MQQQPKPTPWSTTFRIETAPIIQEPFFACLAEAIATVESAAGTHAIHGPLGDPANRNTQGLNEIGYKAIPGKPSTLAPTHEAASVSTPTSPTAANNPTNLPTTPNNEGPKVTSEIPLWTSPTSQPQLTPQTLAFRLFRDRAEQATSLLYLLRTSPYYEAARLLFILAFYSAYAPGRTDGITALLQVFNRIATTGTYAGVRPLHLTNVHNSPSGDLDPDTRALNHAAARVAVRLFAELTQ